MNKQLYRVIFSKHLQRLVVVSEKTRLQGKSGSQGGSEPNAGLGESQVASQNRANAYYGKWATLCGAVLIGLGLANLSYANTNNPPSPSTPTTIITDPTALKSEQATILTTASGLTQVNIQTPSAAGVSKNTFSQFDVGNAGAILNNSRTNTNTQLAGFVQGNPWLATGEAKVILNQVNSVNPSYLGGYIEIAGKKADIIIANPSGLQINGAGFINAGNVNLVAGTSVMQNGQLSAYKVDAGTIDVQGKLNTKDTNYTALIAKAIQINDEVYAGNQLDVITGENTIHLKEGQLTNLDPVNRRAITQTNQATNEGVALDISSLGGMYAGKIRLVGTDKGFGVTNAGVIASVGVGDGGGLTLDSQGNLTNTGSVSAKDKITLNTHDGIINNKGTVSSEQSDVVLRATNLTNAGTIHSTQTNHLSVDKAINNQGDIYGGVFNITTNHLDNTGKLIQTGTGTLTLETDLLTNQDKAVIGQSLYTDTKLDTINTPSTAQTEGGVSANTQNGAQTNLSQNTSVLGTPQTQTKPIANGFIKVNQAITNTGDNAIVAASGAIEVIAQTTLNQNEASLDAKSLATDTLKNTNSKIALESVDWQLNQFDNTKGSLSTKTYLKIDTKSDIVNKEGSLSSDGDIWLGTKHSIDNTSGSIVGQGDVSLQGMRLDNQAGLIATNKQALLSIEDTLNNTEGQVVATKTLKISALPENTHGATAVDNTKGKLLSDALVDIHVKSLHNQGEIAGKAIQIKTLDDLVHDSQSTLIADNLSIQSQGKIINKDKLVAGDELSIKANNIDNAPEATISAKSASLDTQTLTNQGLIHADDLKIKAQTLQNLGAKIYGTDIHINASTLLNQGATKGAIIAAQNSLGIGVDTLNNQHGETIHTNGTDNAWLLSLGTLSVHGKDGGQKANNINNFGARIESEGDMVLSSDNITNSNANFVVATEKVLGSERTKEYIIPEHTSEKIDTELLTRRPWSRAGYYTYKDASTLSVNLENLGKAPIASIYACQGGEETRCTLNYDADSLVWQYFNIVPPDSPMPIINVEVPEPTLPKGETEESCAKDNPSAECLTYNDKLATYKKAVRPFEKWEEDNLAKLEALDAAISEYNAQFGSPQFKNYTIIKVQEHEEKTVVKTSAPAQLISGGDLTLSADKVVNDKSHILASDKITVEGGSLENIDAKGEHDTISHGTTQWTNSRWRGGFKRYHQRDWGKEAPFTDKQTTAIVLPVTAYQEQANTETLAKYKNNQVVIDGADNQTVAPSQVDISNNLKTKPTLTLPNSALYTINADNPNQAIVQTDPAFTNYKQWLSSDYMLNMLQSDPNHKHKRLGDGYYEQQLIKDQILSLTGKRYLGDRRSDESMYQSLMQSGITVAKALNLQVGIALTPEQVASLTTDIVWLVEELVTLKDKDGNAITQKVLVPKVYVRSNSNQIKPDGSLIAANNIDLNLTGALTNQGQLVAHKNLTAKADTITNQNGGLIKGNFVSLNATSTINNIGGTLAADSAMSLSAKEGINNISTTYHNESQQGKSSSERTGIAHVAKIYVGDGLKDKKDENGKPLTTLSVNTDGKLTFEAGVLENEGGSTRINATKGVSLDAVKVGHRIEAVADTNNYYKESESKDIGSTLNGYGDMVIATEGDIDATALKASSQTGTLALIASGENSSINIKEGRESKEVDIAYHMQSKGFLSKKSTKDRHLTASDNAISSTLDGDKILLSATKDITLTAVQAVSDNHTQIGAGRDVTIDSAQNHSQTIHERQTKKSGFMSAGSMGFSVGKEKSAQNTTQTSTTQVGSTVGSLKGDTTIIAKDTYTQNASTVSSPVGDVNIVAGQVTISSKDNTYQSTNNSEYEKKGITVSANIPIVNSVQTALNTTKTIGQSSNDRINAMATANAAWQVKKTAQDVGKLVQGASLDSLNPSISISYGQQKSTSQSHTQSTTAQGSQVNAGGQVNIIATGGQNSSIIIHGSDVAGRGGTHLSADHDVTITAAKQTQTEDSTNSSRGFSVGANISAVGGHSATLGANRGKGNSHSQTTTHRHSHVGDEQSQTTINAGNHLTLKGAGVKGEEVIVAADKLTMSSVQDTATYHSNQQNVSASATFGTGASVGGDYGKSNIDANYTSVTEQTGIFAGDKGAKVTITGHTDITGAVMTSTAKAEQEGKNQFTTGTLAISHLDNESYHKGDSLGIGATASISANTLGQTPTPDSKLKVVSTTNGVSTNGIGYGQDNHHQTSTTQGGIYTQNITITDQTKQADIAKAQGNSVQDIITNAHISTTTTEYQNNGYQATTALTNGFDKDEVQRELNTQVAVTKDFGQLAPQAVADFSEGQRDKYLEQLNNPNLTDEEAKAILDDAQKWEEGGIYRVALHTATGLLATGTIEGGLSAGTTAYAIPKIDEYLTNQGFDKETRDITLLALSAGIGASIGDSTASTANNVGQTQWNYLSHTELSAWKTSLINCSGNQQCIDNVNAKYDNLNKTNFSNFENYCTINFNAQRCHNLIRRFEDGTQGNYNLQHMSGLYTDISRLGGKDASTTINGVRWNNAAGGYYIEMAGSSNIHRHNGNELQALAGELANERLYGGGRGGTVAGSGGYRVGVVNNTAVSNKKDSEQSKGGSEMLGANGTQTFSTTVWKEKGSKARIDVENPNPGVRAGQIHYQDSNNKKYYYNPNDGKFYEGKVENGVLAPKSIQDLLKDKKFKDGIDKGLKYLGEK